MNTTGQMRVLSTTSGYQGKNKMCTCKKRRKKMGSSFFFFSFFFFVIFVSTQDEVFFGAHSIGGCLQGFLVCTILMMITLSLHQEPLPSMTGQKHHQHHNNIFFLDFSLSLLSGFIGGMLQSQPHRCGTRARAL